MATKNPSLAIIMTVLFFVLLQTLSEHETAEKLIPQTTTQPNILQQLIGKISEFEESARNALSIGKKDLAKSHQDESMKLRQVFDSLHMGNVHTDAAKDAASDLKIQDVQNHSILAIKHTVKAKNLVSGAKCFQPVERVETAHTVNGYNENNGNEDYGSNSCKGEINLSYSGQVEPSRQAELFENDTFVNTVNKDTYMSTKLAFNDLRSSNNSPVQGIRMYRDNDLSSYAPFRSNTRGHLKSMKQNSKRGIRSTRMNRKQFEKFEDTSFDDNKLKKIRDMNDQLDIDRRKCKGTFKTWDDPRGYPHGSCE